MTSWMAGLFYLPRLFANHVDAKNNKEMYNKFLHMEKKLLNIIMTPAMILTIVLGLFLSNIYGLLSFGRWFHIKVLLVILLLAQHLYWMHCYKVFKNHANKRKPFFYKMLGEVTTILFVAIVILVVIKPFEE